MGAGGEQEAAPASPSIKGSSGLLHPCNESPMGPGAALLPARSCRLGLALNDLAAERMGLGDTISVT